jgi:hypothetical protein
MAHWRERRGSGICEEEEEGQEDKGFCSDAPVRNEGTVQGETVQPKGADEDDDEDWSYFGLLPEEVVVYIVGFLEGREILRMQCVSRRFRRVGADERVWTRLCLRDFKMRYLTSQALWINYTRGYASGGPSSKGPRLPFFPFAQPATKHTVAPRRGRGPNQ